MVKNQAALQETQVQFLGQEDPPGESHGQRSLAGTVHGVTKSQTRLSNFTLVMKLKVKESESKGHSVVSDSL